MKYPQLVSTRAVNAISDWLVSRLEQLGVEAPLIYSRLLLSLLHSSVQINDPIEFNNLETYLANRKGSKRIPRCDTDALKKITAVQCLMDTVSSEQEITKVENLIDELCDKLSDIEKQNNNNEEELPKESPTTKNIETEDPRKRYYRAFPALSKEMEDSVWISKRNAKALTWPTGNNITAIGSNVNALNNTAGVKRKPKRRRNQGKSGNVRKNSFGGNCSPTWDTDFEGSWEMGRDLIKEFIVMQNNRNRSTSESDACNIRSHDKRMKPMFVGEDEEFYSSNNMSQSKDDNKNDMVDAAFDDDTSAYSDILQNEISITHQALLSDEGYSTHEALTSLSEMDNNNPTTARRLYERDISNDSLNVCSAEQSDFAQFKAKFNSSVEALWKNNNNNEVTSLPSNHQNLENFWTNYYNHHYDVDKFAKNQSIDNPNDFFSMPANLGKIEKSIKINNRKMIENFAPTGVFLQDSIWSDNPGKNYEQDDSFYANVLGSSYKSDAKIDNSFYEVKDPSYSFNISKWSECSFETPFVPSSSASSLNEPSTALNKNDLRENMLKNSYLYSFRQPVAPASSNTTTNSSNNTTPKSHTLQSTPTSLPDIYGSLNMGEKNSDKPHVASQASVSLLNHSATSGFIDYSRIKTIYKFETSNNYNKTAEPIDDCCPNRSNLQTPSSDDENLLTSDRTHFRPIKHSYADGHQFDICNSFDDVKFERSESGYLYVESEKYLEYTRFDTLLSDDEPAFSVAGDGSIKIKSELALKFRIKQTDKYCQTDPSFNEGYILRANIRNISTCQLDDESSDSESMTDDNYLNEEEQSNSIDQWSMAEIGKRCAENNNTHTLWGMCPACNKDNKSVPANRLLKDELNIEADEIMSDLKYMQDLYIGSDWEDDDDTDCDADTIKDCELFQSLEPEAEQDEQEHILYSVTKFISDLLKPENAKSLANALGANQNFRAMVGDSSGHSKNILKTTANDGTDNVNNNNEVYVGGLWSNDENIIWKTELKPINDNILPHLNNNNNKSSTFLEKLNWEYSNLADIWKTASQNDKETTSLPASSSSQNYSAKMKHIDPNDNNKCTEEISNKNFKNLISLNISQQNYNSSSSNNKMFDNDNNRVHNFCTNKVVNRFDRKRRHSASQNVNILSTTSNNTTGSGGSAAATSMISTAAAAATSGIIGSSDFCGNVIIGNNKIEVMAKRDLDYGKLTNVNDSPATIITCKYWATLDTTTASPFFTDKGSHYDGFSAMAMNPSSILKHVAVVSRPLTR